MKIVLETLGKLCHILSVDYNKAKQRYARKYRGYELKKRVVGSLLSKGYDYEDIKELTEEDSYEND